MKKVIIIVPILNEERLLDNFYNSLKKKCSELSKYRFKILFVVDKSEDNTENIINAICKRDEDCSAIIMKNIYGHQECLFAGLYNSENFDIIITMDGDFQHPIDFIESLLLEYENGSDVVFTSKKIAYKKRLIITFLSNFFYQLFNFLSEAKLVSNSSDFRLITKKILKKFLEKKWKYAPFLRAEFLKLSENKKILSYSTFDRTLGKSKFTFLKLLKLAAFGLFTHSNRAIKIIFFLLIASLLSKVYLLNIIFNQNDSIFYNLINFFLILLFTVCLLTMIYWIKLKLEINKKTKNKIYEIKKKLNIQ